MSLSKIYWCVNQTLSKANKPDSGMDYALCNVSNTCRLIFSYLPRHYYCSHSSLLRKRFNLLAFRAFSKLLSCLAIIVLIYVSIRSKQKVIKPWYTRFVVDGQQTLSEILAQFASGEQ